MGIKSMNCTRRNFLIGGSTTLFLTGFLSKQSFGNINKNNLVIISLRGGMDGLTAVPVLGDKRLKKLRRELILEQTLKLNSDFALHPKLEIFHQLWKENKAALVIGGRGCGKSLVLAPDPTIQICGKILML